MHDLLRKTYLFSHLDSHQLARVIAMSRKLSLHDGETLFTTGDKAECFFLVIAGQIKLSRLAPNGNEKVIEIVGAGNTFAEALMFSDSPAYPVTASSIDESAVIAFGNKAFTALLRESIDTCFRLMSDMSQRLHSMIKEIDDLTLQSAMGRVAGFLLDKGAHLQGDISEFALEAPKGVIASRLSITPETLSRILSSLSSQGLIRVKGSWITLLDREGLNALASTCNTGS